MYTGMNTLSKSILATKQRRAEAMLPDEMEAEKNRKMILAQADEIEILKKNVHDLQEQYQSALRHNKTLIQRIDELTCNQEI